ncbi:MAG: tRNA (5-methylaminomethyl-2-thiouridine)(34)-methyltransferase MnmD, partial [Rubrivivax sp.]
MSGPGLSPARIDFTGPVPRSLDYGDIYHSADGASAQAQHVFLRGNGLPQRWQGRRHFAILETGFGLGHNFLATLAAWQADPLRCSTLHFVSVEGHPPSRQDLSRALELSPHTPQAQALLQAWPALLKGLHVLTFDAEGRVCLPATGGGSSPDHADGAPCPGVRLTLALGDARELLPSLVGPFDAFFLDGFTPTVNPEFWDPRLLRVVGRLAAPGAMAAT